MIPSARLIARAIRHNTRLWFASAARCGATGAALEQVKFEAATRTPYGVAF